MIGLLESIFDFVQAVPDMILWAGETAINGLFEGLANAAALAVETLPSLPEPSAPPTIDAWMNWFYPVAGVMAVAATVVTAYVTFLAVRQVLKIAGIL